MKQNTSVVSRFMLTILILSCIFGNLFSFLDVDLGIIVLTPFRFILILTVIYCGACWINHLRKKEFISVLKQSCWGWITFGFFIIWFALGIAWIIFGSVSDQAFPDVIGILTTCMLAFCCFTLVKDQKDGKYFLLMIELFGLILAVLACIETVCGSFVPNTSNYYTLVQRINMNQTFFAPTTVFHNQNDFAAFMLLCLAVGCYRILSAKTFYNFLWSIVYSCVLIVPVVLTDSTIFYLSAGALICLMVLGILALRRGTWKSRLLRAGIVTVIAIAFVLFGSRGIRSAAIELNDRYFTNRINEFYAQATVPDNSNADEDVDVSSNHSKPDTQTWTPPEVVKPDDIGEQMNAYNNNYGTIHVRLWLIRAGLDFTMDSPIVGNGPASFGVKMHENREYLNQARGVTNTHCFYTELLSQYGIILFVIYMGIVLYLFICSGLQTIRELRNGCPGWGVLCLLLTGTFSVAIMMPSSIVRLTPIWIFLILAVCMFRKGLCEK